jgi:hypothetical protein
VTIVDVATALLDHFKSIPPSKATLMGRGCSRAMPWLRELTIGSCNKACARSCALRYEFVLVSAAAVDPCDDLPPFSARRAAFFSRRNSARARRCLA